MYFFQIIILYNNPFFRTFQIVCFIKTLSVISFANDWKAQAGSEGMDYGFI